MDLLIFWDSGAPSGFELPFSRTISGMLAIPARVCPNPIVMNGYDGSRRQTDARALLDTIDTFRQRRHIKDHILVVYGNDIFAPGVSSLFGLARPSAGVAVVSTARLSNEYYGLSANDDDLIDRAVKEGAHEIGHLYGLAHCQTDECIMYAPLTLDELDRKKRWFCPGCQSQLDSARAEDSPL